jgi:hypothetical protein
MYERGIKQVGIEYLKNGWWWDIFENLVFYGDPDLMVYAPNNAWAKPLHLPTGTSVDGHNIYGATSHPNEIGTSTLLLVVLGLAILGAIAAVIIIYRKVKYGVIWG